MSDDAIVLVPYNEKWPGMAREEIVAIRAAVPNLNFEIEHVGSTAVPGLLAKPVLDLLIGVDSLEAAKQFIAPLEKMGYSYWRENPKAGHFYFVKGLPLVGGAGRTHHVHLYQKDHEAFKNQLLFRNYLRAHPESTQAYSLLKQELAYKFSRDREAYTEAKTDIVNSILKLAEQEPSSDHLKLAQACWELTKFPIFHRYLANHIYFSANSSEDLVLRLTPGDHRTKSEVIAEISFLDYLARKDFPLAVPIVSKNKRLVEEINFQNKKFLATVFKKIDGEKASDEESLEPDFLFKWGAYLAQLHNHSIAFGKTESSLNLRPQWELDAIKVKAMSFSKSSSEVPSKRLLECVDWLSQLDKEDENYGLIHGDLHRGNFFVVEGKIVSFDYDDSCYHWFMYDVAASLSTVLKLAKNENDRQKIIENYFRGYESVRSVSNQSKSRFEVFYQYRLALVFNWMNAMIAEGRFSPSTLEDWKSVEPWYIENMKRQADFR